MCALRRRRALMKLSAYMGNPLAPDSALLGVQSAKCCSAEGQGQACYVS